MSKAELVKLAAVGDSSAITELHKKSFGMIENFARNVLRSSNDKSLTMEDIVSVSMEKVWYAASHLHEGIQFNTLYYTAMHNYVVTIGRRGRIDKTHSRGLKNAASKPVEVWDMPAMPKDEPFAIPDPDQLADHDSGIPDWQLENFTPAQRGYINLVLAGFSEQEIAEMYV